jgi:hypothetical protein
MSQGILSIFRSRGISPLLGFYGVSDCLAFAILISHTSFQLYHCKLPRRYLESIHDTGNVEEGQVILSCTRSYDFQDPRQRGEWFDIVVALIEYLRSGESKVGFLNNSVERNMIHKENNDMDDDVCEGIVELDDGDNELQEAADEVSVRG